MKNVCEHLQRMYYGARGPWLRERESPVSRECFNECTPSPIPGGFSREGIICAEESNEGMICLHYVSLM